MPAYTDTDVQAAIAAYWGDDTEGLTDLFMVRAIGAVAPAIAARAKAEALREVIEESAITIPDALGWKVGVVYVEDLLTFADELERNSP